MILIIADSNETAEFFGKLITDTKQNNEYAVSILSCANCMIRYYSISKIYLAVDYCYYNIPCISINIRERVIAIQRLKIKWWFYRIKSYNRKRKNKNPFDRISRAKQNSLFLYSRSGNIYCGPGNNCKFN